VVFSEAFRLTNSDLDLANLDVNFSGTTAVTFLLRGNKLI